MSSSLMLCGRRAVTVLIVGLCVACGSSFALAQPFGRPETFEEARQLEQDGQAQAAFLKYLVAAGGESAAVALARPQASEFLKLLADQGAAIPAVRRRLIEAELLLATRDKVGALAAFRDVASKIAIKDEQGWEQGLLPRGQYFVERPMSEGLASYATAPFTTGPGSHRDNWLLRRFFALEAWDDARREFARVWQLHREATQPYVVQTPKYDDTDKVIGNEKHDVKPAGFTGGGLLFALDYAFFLQKRNDADAARVVLIEALTLIDMDHNPNERHFGASYFSEPSMQHPARSGGTGLPRTEFIRLAFGVLKTAGREKELVTSLTASINAGENRLRRVLAQVRLLQGQAEAAHRLELDYIAAADFDPVSTAYRRAVVHDAAQKIKGASTEFEIVLTLLDGDGVAKLNLSDPLELAAGAARQSAMMSMPFRSPSPNDKASAQREVFQQLERLYAALGETDKALEMTRRQFVVSGEYYLLASLEELVRKHRAVNQSERLSEWAKQQLVESQDHHVRACLNWLLGDRKAAAESLAKSGKTYELELWKQRYRDLGKESLRELLKAFIAVNPQDVQSQFELLDLDGVVDGPELVKLFEMVLESNPGWAFSRPRGSRIRPPFRDQFELASRLMRLYERAGQLDKVQTLGLRIARGEKPFAVNDSSQYEYRRGNGSPESANAALAIAIQHADTVPKSEQLGAALEKSFWAAAREQFRRCWFEGKSEPPAPFRWANLPDGVELIASNENVLALANDDRYVYAGHPWGVAVYDLAGRPVIRVALGEAARVLVTLDGYVWVGTPKGLFRIARADWSVAHQWLHDDVPANERHSRNWPGADSYWFDNSVYALAADGEQLWIGLHRNVQRLNTRTLELRAYSFDELKISSWAGFQRFVLDGQYVWADSGSGVRRYDRVTDEWSAPEHIGPSEPIQLADFVDGRVFGDVYVDNHLRHRLCLIDRKTLAITVIPLVTKKEEHLVNDPLRHFGKLGEQLVFGTDWPVYVFDEVANTLKPIGSKIEQINERLRLRNQKHSGDEGLRGALAAWDRMAEFTVAFGRPDPGHWLTLTLPDGTRVLGSRQNRVRYEVPQEDFTYSRGSRHADIPDREGGLFFIQPDSTAVRVSSEETSDSIRGDLVRDVVFSPKGNWLCTSQGVARMDREGRIINHFSRADGLCANRVTGGAELLGKFYFTTGWGNSGGGLAVFDPATSVFTTLSHKDGLPTDKLESVQVQGQQLQLSFGVEWLHTGDVSYRLFAPTTFDPKTNRFGPSGEPKLLKQSEAEERDNKTVPETLLPFLGGYLSKRIERDGLTYLCGTRGLVILRDAATEMQVAPLGAKPRLSIAALQLADAEQRQPDIESPEDLETALKDMNPFYRANALAALLGLKRPLNDAYLPLVASQLADPNVRVRATALYFVTQFADDNKVIPFLRAKMNDSDRQMRELAMVDLVRRRQLPDLRLLKRRFESCQIIDNYWFGAKSSIGVEGDCEQLLEALAPHATPEVFALLLEFPPSLIEDRENKVFPALGESLRRHRAAADFLLKARDDNDHSRTQFVRGVFRSAGKELLPKLHDVLKSDDRVIRSNAARACGAIGDPSSIAPLLKAIDLESGLSRASIVWALGELKAKEALPALANLYAEAKQEGLRRERSGVYAGQQAAAMSSQYEQISNLESLSADWDELKAATLAPVVDPEKQEDLLQPEHILEAVAKIGPEWSQEFYRSLAASKDLVARREAAESLGAGTKQDRAKNLVILKNLLTDADFFVRLRASASLVQWNDANGRALILETLNSEIEGHQQHAMEQLSRLGNHKLWAFAKKRIEAIAADEKAQDETRQDAARLLRDLLDGR